MNESFDIAAITYDTTFTHSKIGKLQRNLVFDHLTKMLPPNQKLDILEINCGTGHDAIWLAEQGHRVIATDISSEMISIAKSKQHNQIKDLEFLQLDINKLSTLNSEQPFDLIFSDFGGLNCLSPDQLKEFFIAAQAKLKPNGIIVGVIMPKQCLMENIYFTMKGKFKQAFRRNTDNVVIANVDGVDVNTWYYNPKMIQKISSKLFKTNELKPIGLWIPPSYLESFFKNKSGILKILSNLDMFFRRFAFLSKYSDHYLISLIKK
ncbi:class I SAM-dependent methyltransferase [Aquimarina sp. MMG015]|uniref:class I SAM-dependent methyltransferase n=1 Tax=unclassified Aquimarina TaxID=2627091 RepID=UPI000E47497F|nr:MULTISPECIES: class I SAM-dependent methyltransferase [unclassified Aquimarina]AXT54380.1 class I SAM-dependent methyltransferase [Aquimarina sp. AD1]MBQ4804081.1 class I SAM-dependent methyltransferase [Aquimarina sp. MMG015]RKN08503.1 methyltransferase domain-containing protein [Aquimarina sp. AD1]